MNRNLILAIAAFGCGSVICGCNVGMQPTGPSVEEINAIRSKWPPEKQIEGIQFSPMPPAEKKRRIAEIRKKYNMPDETPSSNPTPGRAPAKTP